MQELLIYIFDNRYILIEEMYTIQTSDRVAILGVPTLMRVEPANFWGRVYMYRQGLSEKQQQQQQMHAT